MRSPSRHNGATQNKQYTMKKICINNRDEMIMIFVDNIAYIIADGNYTKVTYISGMQVVFSIGLARMEKIISDSFAEKSSPFVRLGRSVIINQRFIYDINLQKQTLQLSDNGNNCLTLKLPKLLLKKYKATFTSTE